MRGGAIMLPGHELGAAYPSLVFAFAACHNKAGAARGALVPGPGRLSRMPEGAPTSYCGSGELGSGYLVGS